tara:strand:+ start:148 stop:468 length:321 start_codon:yes stop_codon:yes gene_type:complete
MPVKYNENITLSRHAHSQMVLADWEGEDEYFALMVTDIEGTKHRDILDYYNYPLGYIGLEERSDGKIYISKDYDLRDKPTRGIVYVVKVKDVSECCVLKERNTSGS